MNAKKQSRVTNKKLSKAALTSSTKRATQASAKTSVNSSLASKGVSPAQVSYFMCMAVWAWYTLDLGTAIKKSTTEQDLTEADFCSAHFTAHEGSRCSVGELVFMKHYRQSLILTMITVTLLALLCWGNDPLHQRMNMYLTQGFGLQMLAICVSPETWEMSKRMQLLLTCMVLTGVIMLGVKAGIQVSREVKFTAVINAWIVVLATSSALGLANYARMGPSSLWVASDETSVSQGTVMLFHFTLAQHMTRFLLLFFGMFYFDSTRKGVMVVFHAMVTLFQYSKLSSIENIRNLDMIALYLWGTAIISFIAAFVPESGKTVATEERRSKKNKIK